MFVFLLYHMAAYITASAYLDFANVDDGMYGVLDCCTHVNAHHETSLLASFYDYLHRATAPYSRSSHDLALHMGITACLSEPTPRDDIPAQTLMKSKCLVRAPDRRLMIVDAALQNSQYETSVLKDISMRTQVPLRNCLSREVARSIPLGMFYVAWSAYRYDINSTKYCYSKEATIVAEYGAVLDRTTLSGRRLLCADVTSVGYCPSITLDDGNGYTAIVTWPVGYVETPSFRGADMVCVDVPSQSIYTIIHMYPLLSLRAMSNTGNGQDVANLQTGTSCADRSRGRKYGLCLLSSLMAGLPVDPNDFASASPYFLCLRSFLDGNVVDAYPKCIGDIPDVHRTFGAFVLKIKPYGHTAEGPGFYSRNSDPVSTGCVLSPGQTDYQTVVSNAVYCNAVAVAVLDMDGLEAAASTLSYYSAVLTNMGIVVPLTLLRRMSDVVTAMHREVPQGTVRFVTLDATASTSECFYAVVNDVKPYVASLKAKWPTLKVALKVHGASVACVTSSFEFQNQITTRDVDALLGELDRITLSTAGMRTRIPVRNIDKVPVCPFVWEGRTRSKWLWSPDSETGPYKQEPRMSPIDEPGSTGVIAVPNLIALLGPTKVAVELDTGCVHVAGELYAKPSVTKCARRDVSVCSDRFVGECCGSKDPGGGYRFIQSIRLLQETVKHLMVWGVRNVEFGDLTDLSVSVGGLTLVELLYDILDPKPLVYEYSALTKTVPKIRSSSYCPGVVKITQELVFQRPNLKYLGFYETLAYYPTVGLTANAQLCSGQTENVPVLPQTNEVPHSCMVAYYLHNLETVLFADFKDKSFVCLLFNKSLSVYVKRTQPTHSYVTGQYGRRLPGAVLYEPLDLTGLTIDSGAGVVYITKQRTSRLVSLADAAVDYTLQKTPMSFQMVCSSPFVCPLQKRSDILTFASFVNASACLFEYMGKSIARPRVHGNNTVVGQYVSEGSMPEVMLSAIVGPRAGVLSPAAVYVSSRLSTLLTNRYANAQYRKFSNVASCMLGSSVACWAAFPRSDSRVLGYVASVDDSVEEDMTVSLELSLKAQWVSAYDQTLPLSRHRNDSVCYTVNDLTLFSYPRMRAVHNSDPWGDMSQDSWYMCDVCVNGVCKTNDSWEIYTTGGALAVPEVPLRANKVPIIQLTDMWDYITATIPGTAEQDAILYGVKTKALTERILAVDYVNATLAIRRLSADVSTCFINIYFALQATMLTNVFVGLLCGASILISVTTVVSTC